VSRTRCDAEMIGELRTGEAVREALRIKRQHARIPLAPLRNQPLVDVFVALLQIISVRFRLGPAGTVDLNTIRSEDFCDSDQLARGRL
jgi:hypothetical protein